MRPLAICLAALAFAATPLSAEEAAPADWIAGVTCDDFLTVMMNPMAVEGASGPLTGMVYVGAAMGYIEAYREITGSALAWGPALGAIRIDCRTNPDQLFNDAVKTAFK
jgi:hypothetical protein